MSKLPGQIRNGLKKEAIQWDTTISEESPEQIQGLLNDAEPFKVSRPARQPVSLRMDPFDICFKLPDSPSYFLNHPLFEIFQGCFSLLQL